MWACLPATADYTVSSLNVYARMTLRVCATLACTTDAGIGMNGAAAARARIVHLIDRELERQFATTVQFIMLAGLVWDGDGLSSDLNSTPV